jgi:uncharacterized protein involved in type VI secretion and phage assembly
VLDQALDTGFKIKIAGTPLSEQGKDALVETVVELDSNRPDMAVLRFRDAVWSAGQPTIDLISAFGFELKEDLVLTEARTDETVFTGEIASLEFEYTKAGRHAVIRAYDPSHNLHRGRKTRIFKNMTDSDVFSEVLQGTGIDPGDVLATTVTHQHLPQLNQTDWEFLRWRAEENGYSMESDASGRLCFHEPKNQQVATLDAQTDLFAFRPRLTAPLFTSVEVDAWDATETQVLSATGEIGKTESATLFYDPAGLAGKFTNTRKSASVNRPGLQQAEIERAAKTLAERHSQTFAEAEATAQGNPKLRPGCIVVIKGIGNTFDGKYRISAARHVLNHHGYRTHLVFSGMNDRSALALSSDGLASTPKLPRMHGLVTGIVTQTAKEGVGGFPNAPDEAHVKVKFDWLKDKDGNPYETDWVKTVQLGASKGFGSLIVPEPKDEVLVGFEHGDLRRPYVIGGVYNNVDNKLSNSKLVASVVDPSNGALQRRGFSSRTNHRMSFEDDNTAADGITLVTGDDQFTIVLDKKNTKITIDSKNGKVEIHGSQDISIKNDQGDIVLDAGSGSIKMTAKSDITMDATGDVKMSGTNAKMSGKMNAEISANTEAKMSAGASSLDLTVGSAALKGPIVQIN